MLRREADGTECDWGRCSTWEPPNRFVLAWQIGPTWQYEPDLNKASEVEVRFTAEPDGHARRPRTSSFDRHGSAPGTSSARGCPKAGAACCKPTPRERPIYHPGGGAAGAEIHDQRQPRDADVRQRSPRKISGAGRPIAATRCSGSGSHGQHARADPRRCSSTPSTRAGAISCARRELGSDAGYPTEGGRAGGVT